MKTLFLDRDGVINRQIMDGYVTKTEAFEFLPNVLETLALLSKKFDRIIIVTNQQGIGKGIFSENDLEKIHQYMLSEIVKHGGRIDKIYFSPHLETENNSTRKPAIEMALQAKHDFPEIDFTQSTMVGDSLNDMQFGKNAGMKTVFLNKGISLSKEIRDLADEFFEDLTEFFEKSKQKKIIILGSAYPLRGGLASFKERLCRAFIENGDAARLVTFSLQYPSLLFPGKTQFSNSEKPDLDIEVCVNSINPFNWIKTGKRIQKEKPDILIFKYWTPFMAPCFGTIARIVKKNRHTKIITIVDNLIPHEQHFYDALLTNYFIKPIDACVAMSKSVYDDIEQLNAKIPKKLSPHPLYDNYGEKLPKDKALQRLGLENNYTYFLFFGFIRSYKGLDLLIDAFADARLRKFPVKLIVAGEFYENEKPYLDAIQQYNLSNDIILRTSFIPNEEIKNYFCAADLIVQPYKSATQSGVTQIGYHFEKPMLVTNVGGLAEIIPNGKVGYVVNPVKEEIVDAMLDFLQNKPDFSHSIQEEKQKYTWDKLISTINSIYKLI
jgi:histidinol-phosphate phosphatase family protein